MANLFEKDVYDAFVTRIDALKPTTQAVWGKMNVAQMLAHLSISFESATGNIKPPRMFIGRLLGPFLKVNAYNEKPIPRNSPTAPFMKMVDEKDFEAEKKRLKELLMQFYMGGETKCTTHAHTFFGKFTPEQWAVSSAKHLDHHLMQFGV